jgi:hypothetical protein
VSDALALVRIADVASLRRCVISQAEFDCRFGAPI